MLRSNTILSLDDAERYKVMKVDKDNKQQSAFINAEIKYFNNKNLLAINTQSLIKQLLMLPNKPKVLTC